MQLVMLVVLFVGFTGESHQQTILSIQERVKALQGDNVTLSCKYSSATNFFWYRQYPSSPPQFLIKEYMESINGLPLSSPPAVNMEPWLTIILVLTLWLECKGEDRVTQTIGDFIATEGLTVSLDCTFETTDTNPYLFWYKQQSNDFPRFVLQRSTFGGKEAEEFPKERFDAQIENKSVPLRIQNLQLSDSALYYCALKPTVTGNTDSLYKNLLSTKHTSSAQTFLTKLVNPSQYLFPNYQIGLKASDSIRPDEQNVNVKGNILWCFPNK
ncbi:unnamed protein product [Boreogadus saida]